MEVSKELQDAVLQVKCPICGCPYTKRIEVRKSNIGLDDLMIGFVCEMGDRFFLSIFNRTEENKNFCGMCYLVKEKVNYQEYINSPFWKQLADDAKERAGHRCQVCNRSSDEVILDAHHRTYERLGDELPEDITVLCRDCHELFEMNKKAKKNGQKAN